MQNITSVTNPVPGQEGNTYRSPITPNDPQIQNIPDPSRVGRADARSDRQDTANMNAARRFDSYFRAFIQELRASGSISETGLHFLISQAGKLVTSGMTAGIGEELAQFLQMIQVQPEQLLDLLKNQVGSGQRFTGPLFDTLRSALGKHPSDGLKNDIAQFLRRYNNFSSTAHIARNMQRTIRQMSWFMPERFGSTLQTQLSQLDGLLGKGDRAGALKLLQNTLIPYMSDYVSQMHDRGIARSLLSMLLLDITRFENGSPENMLQSFYQLLGYSSIRDQFSGMDAQELRALLEQSALATQRTENPLADRLSSLSAQAVRGDGGAELRQTLQALMDSILVNQSVYMPLAHAMLPVEMDGRMMFSELWVDPNDESGGASSSGKTMRLLLKFDIQELGLFDLVLTMHGDTVEANLHCPPALGAFSRMFEEKMTELAARNGLKAAAARVSPMDRPLTISEVFPKIFERMDSINVSI